MPEELEKALVESGSLLLSDKRLDTKLDRLIKILNRFRKEEYETDSRASTLLTLKSVRDSHKIWA